MSELLAELASRDILTGVTVKRLREYISIKYPQLSPAQRARIFADAVNRIVSVKLPEVPKDRTSLFKAYLYGGAAKKQVFSIDCSDIFKSSLKLKLTDEEFAKSLKIWLEEAILEPISEDKVIRYLQDASSILDQYPDMDIEKVLESIDNEVGDLRPKKRVITVMHMNPARTAVLEEEKKSGMETEVSVTTQGAEQESPEDDAVVSERSDRGDDWVVIKKRSSAGEAPAGLVSRFKASIDRMFHNISGLSAKRFQSKAGYRAVWIAGLIVAVLLFTFFSALYVNAVEKQVSTRTNDVLEEGNILREYGYIGQQILAAGNDEGSFDEDKGAPMVMRATAYDLSVESCGKDRDHPEYGITFSGTRAQAGRTIAVDPEVIPLGSSVRITFPEEYSSMDGIYVAEDTGRLIKGNSIDIFFGEDENGSNEINRKALDFGVRYVEVVILDNKTASK